MTRAPVTAGVIALVAGAALALVSGASASLSRPLWLDEVVTQLIAQSPRGILHAMRSGVDFQPPPHYFLVRLADALAGTPSDFSARLPSVVVASLTVLLLGATLRTRLSLASALAGALALAAHPLFVAQAVEARPYALWIFATALTAECLRPGRRGGAWLAAIAAIVLCTSHYFGVLSLAALALGVAGYARFSGRRSWTGTLGAVVPLGAGALALLALLPLARAQLAATAGRSWVPAASPDDVRYFLGFIWGWRPALYLIAAGVAFAVARRLPPLAARLPHGERLPLDATLVALLATVMVPLLVVLVSFTYTPVLVLRYSVPAVLALATVCAFAVELLPRPLRWLGLLLLLRAGLFSWQSAAAAGRDDASRVAAEAQAVQQLDARGIPTVSPFRHDAYRASFGTRGMPAVAWMEIPDSLLDRAAAAAPTTVPRNMLLVERAFGRAVRREFGFPAVITAGEARANPAVALLRDAALSAADTLWFPGRSACPLSARLVVYSRPEAATPCPALQGALARR